MIGHEEEEIFKDLINAGKKPEQPCNQDRIRLARRQLSFGSCAV
jgi:hypothetical protein